VEVATVASGALLGLPALVGDKPYSLTAVACAGARVGFVTPDTFSSLMLSEPLLAMMILQVLAAEVRSTRAALSESETTPHRGRALRRKRRTSSIKVPISN
jgi:CRP-like cAMP-binding protein